MTTFYVVKDPDEAGDSGMYDRMKQAMDADAPCQTVLQRPPADRALALSPRIGINVLGACRNSVALVARAKADVDGAYLGDCEASVISQEKSRNV